MYNLAPGGFKVVDSTLGQALVPSVISSRFTGGLFREVGQWQQAKSVHQLFEDRTSATPGAIAVSDGSESWTYAQLNASANRLANRLSRLSLAPESLIGVCLPRSLQSIAALVGILKAGFAYLPLDMSYPQERLRFMLNDTHSPCIVTDQTGTMKLSKLVDSHATLIRADQLTNEATQFTSTALLPRSLAYVTYTSGSTGAPKGVMIEHSGILRLVTNPGYISVHSDDVFIHLAPLSFDASTFEIWTPLLNGARLVVPLPDVKSLACIAAAIENHHVTCLWLTSGLFNAVVDEYPDSLRAVKYMLAGGDVLSPRHVRQAMQHIQSGTVINGYGPTENTTFTCCHTISLEDTTRNSIPIGRAIRATEVYILDENHKPVVDQETGEIYIGGEGLARGYWNQPELTAEKFIANPFSTDPSSRLYRSGDLAHRNPRGEIEFDGRIDQQVKIRGFRIEPAEIEAAVNAIEGIAESAVVVKDAQSDTKRLACYFVRRPHGATRAWHLDGAVRKAVPAYMVPSEFVELDKLPLNANGKVDRQALTQLVSESSRQRINDAEAKSLRPIEQDLAAIMRALFCLPGMSAEDNFFQLGGNSLIAARLFARIEKQFGLKLPLSTILQAPTVRQLAAFIERSASNPIGPNSIDWSPLVPLKNSGSRPPLFLVHAVGGNVVGYQTLALCLDDDQPVYALRARGLDGSSAPAASIPEMAASYVECIRSVQRDGPYHLAGYSAGGVLAFAMACQLQQDGAEAGSLTLIDSSIEDLACNLSRPALIGRWRRIFRGNLAYLRDIGPPRFTAEKLRNLKMNARIAWHCLYKRFLRSSPMPQLNVEESCILALRHYTPGRFHGDALLLRTREAQLFSSHPALGWDSVIDGSISITHIQGNHGNILSPPQVELVASAMRDRLCAQNKFHAKKA